MTTLNLPDGWNPLPDAAFERIAMAEMSDVILRRTGDDPVTGPRHILKAGGAVSLPAGVAMSAAPAQPGVAAAVTLVRELPLRRSRMDPGVDMFPITPSDSTDLPQPATALYIGGAGNLSVITLSGQTRTWPVNAFALIPVGVLRVRATGTTASQVFGIV